MNRYIVSFLLLSLSMAASAEDISSIMSRIMDSNVTLKKYRAQTDATKADNNVGLTLADPEVGFNYLWGSPNDVGQRKDITVTQHFDYATVFGLKRRGAKSRNELAEVEYEQAKMLLQREALMTLTDIAAANEKVKEQEARIANAEMISAMMKKKMDAGDANKIEMNKILLDLAKYKAEHSEAVMERDALLSDVIFMQMMDDDVKTCLCALTIDEVKEYASTLGCTTMLQIEQEKAQKEESAADADLRLARSASLPELTAGYMSELTHDEKFRGVTLGISIPLWSNRGNVAKAKQQKISLIAEREEAIANIQAQRNAAVTRLKHLSQFVDEMESLLKTASSESLLLKALTEGEISIIDFVSDREAYYDIRSRLLDAKSEQVKLLLEIKMLSPAM